MAARTRKKPSARKPAASSGKGRFASIGWLATAAVAGAWALSDGRSLHQVSSLAEDVKAKVVGMAKGDRIASLIEEDPEPAPARRPKVERHPVLAPVERTGSIQPAVPRPAPIQSASIPRPTEAVPSHAPDPRVAVAVPSPAPLLPFAAPRPDTSLARTVSLPVAATTPVLGSAPVGPGGGGERHATRQLAIHAAPDGASPRLSAVESGDSVLVLRSAGDWRYVRNVRANKEGWVDGRFLAGEATADAGLPPR